ncbi:aspartate kinase [Aminicella lysinilytica]|uniref:Aspartokinase n=1 Tax=Aminicella lysinilytica TaxID=433323 RepID=A0A4R6QEC3_9FIRM|nr:aspartate kinase [Aminicella lysinilytica]TDP60577.1 aspartate kinase [Aminicella lysinilytica]
MGVKVAKFGGSSVADGIQLTKTKAIINADPDRKFVVVSAPGKRFESDNKITDLLYLCQTHMEQNIPYDQVFQVVTDRFAAVKMNLNIDVDLQTHFDAIHEQMKQETTSDYIASRGEYLSAVLVAAFMGYDFVDTAGLILFDNKGRLLAEETNEALKTELAKHENAVLPGFYGTCKDTGKVKTFSRGGSDITGSLVARAVEADAYENWTDVSGFLMADPRIVKNPKPIDRISYKELRELSYMGASVLHEDAIYPVRIANIPINIRNTNFPEDKGTIITAEDETSGKVVTGIAGNKDFTVIALYKNMLSKEKGFVRRILMILEDFDINFEHLPSGIDTVSVVISNDAIDGRLDEIVDEFNAQLKPDNIEIFENIALIATVGYGMSFRPGVSATLFSALAEAKVNIRMIDQGSSEMNIIVGVENKDFNKAIKAIYEAFV